MLQLHKGKMIRGVCLDYGREDFANENQSPSAALGRLAQDVRNVWKGFGHLQDDAVTVYLPVDDDISLRVASFLRRVDIIVEELRFRADMVSAASGASYAPGKHLSALGAAAAALSSSTDELCFHSSAPAVSASSWRRMRLSWPVSLAVMALALITFLLVWYRYDVARRDHLSHLFTESAYAASLETLAQKQELRRFVAGQRPDMLELLEGVHSALPESMLIDKITFRQGQRLRIEGHTPKADDILTFQENLQKCDDFNFVHNEGETTNSEKKYTAFILSCDYKQFTRKQ
mgnify:CR=1 FL=1